jgi:hypothetical protein
MIANPTDAFTYIKFRMDSLSLADSSREILEMMGVECLEEGAAYEAYGIVPTSQPLFRALERVPGVREIDFSDPPVGK